MAGEFKIADHAVAAAIAEAETFSGMTEDGVLHALLNNVLAKLVTTKSKADLVSHIEFLIDSQSQGSIVITHGC
jgi:predicted FMN-binding regulatory protein PaiB